MDVIVLGYNHHNTLGLIRSLGEAGYTVHLILLKSGFNYVNKSKYLESWFLLDSLDELIPCVKDIGEVCGSKPVMFASGDGEATFINQHFEELSKICFVEGAYTNGDIAIYHDKFRSNELAEKFGFLIPKTWNIRTKDDIPSNLSFPLLVKAGDSIRGGKSVLKKCSSEEELKSILNYFTDSVYPLQLQEYIQKDYEVIILGCSVNHGHQVFCPVGERKLRFYPQEFQTTAYTESLLIDKNCELKKIAERVSVMIKHLGYTGLFSVELIYADQQYYFLETNFRNDGTGYLATKCGYNLPDLLCKSFEGTEVSIDNFVYEPCHYVNVIADGMNALSRKVPFFTWVRQMKKAKCYSLYSKKDRKPLIYAICSFFINRIFL